jgi:hypothetical protein
LHNDCSRVTSATILCRLTHFVNFTVLIPLMLTVEVSFCVIKSAKVMKFLFIFITQGEEENIKIALSINCFLMWIQFVSSIHDFQNRRYSNSTWHDERLCLKLCRDCHSSRSVKTPPFPVMKVHFNYYLKDDVRSVSFNTREFLHRFRTDFHFHTTLDLALNNIKVIYRGSTLRHDAMITI